MCDDQRREINTEVAEKWEGSSCHTGDEAWCCRLTYGFLQYDASVWNPMCKGQASESLP